MESWLAEIEAQIEANKGNPAWDLVILNTDEDEEMEIVNVSYDAELDRTVIEVE